MEVKLVMLLFSLVILLALCCTTLRSSTLLPCQRMASSQRSRCCESGRLNVRAGWGDVCCQSVWQRVRDSKSYDIRATDELKVKVARSDRLRAHIDITLLSGRKALVAHMGAPGSTKRTHLSTLVLIDIS